MQLNLVSDQANTALLTDPNLVDAWGIGLSPTGGEFFVSDNVPGVATQYGGAVNGSPLTRDPLVVQIPFGSPSGAVFNGTGDFKLNDGNPARFLVSQETPWAGGWDPGLQPPTSGQFVVDTVPAGAVYKGITVTQDGTSNFLYLANIRSGAIEVYDTHFNRVALPGNFNDPTTTVPLPSNFAPFNVQNIGGKLFVTYAMQNANKDGDVPGAGHGFIDVFNPDGTFVKRLVSNGPLNSPWGLALAPANFGDLSGDLLVGNFGDGAINAFNPTTGAFVGTLNDAAGNPIHIDGLWGLQFGNGVSAGDSNVLFYSAGPAAETHGLFGALHANGTNPLTGTGSGTITGTEGAPLQGVLATFTDTNPGKTAADFSATVTINGQTSAGAVAANPNGPGFFVSGPNTSPPAGSDAVTVTIQEKANPNASVTVNAQAAVAAVLTPVGSSNAQVSGSEGGFTGPLAHFADTNAAAQPGDFTATVTWGNSVTNPGMVARNADGTFTVSGTNPSPEDGSFPSSVAVHDNANHSLTIPFTYVVPEPGQTGRGLTVATDSSGVFSNAVLATFTHGAGTEPATAFTATINWGDGATTPGTVALGGDGYVVKGSHTYSGPGTRNVAVMLTDEGVAFNFTAMTSVAAPPPEPTAPTAPTVTRGQHFVTQIVHDLLGQAADAQTLQRFGSEFDQGTGAGQVALNLVDSFGKSLHQVVRRLTGGGSTGKRARRLFQNLLNHPPDPKGDAALLRGVARKLARRRSEDQALGLVLGSPAYLAKVPS
jgi:uncharacterized protein (TIGR03118 family)